MLHLPTDIHSVFVNKSASSNTTTWRLSSNTTTSSSSPPGAHAISIETNAERAAVYIIDRHPSLPLSLFSLSLARSLSLSLSPSIETNTERAAVDVINGSDRRRLDSPFIPHFAVARAAGQVHPDLRAPRHVHGVADGKEEGKPRKHARRIGSWEDGNVHVAVELAVKIACVYVI